MYHNHYATTHEEDYRLQTHYTSNINRCIFITIYALCTLLSHNSLKVLHAKASLNLELFIISKASPIINFMTF